MIINKYSPWIHYPNNWVHPWHSMSSYLASFPASLVNVFIKMLSKKNDIILDPFSGRGTTLLECRIENRYPIASDLNPISVSLTEAKNTDVNVKETLKRIDELENNYDRDLFIPEANSQPDNISLIYHTYTLAELCYLQRELLKTNTDVDKFLIGVVLGIMHGGEKKDGTSSYASISMPNTFSMSPNYIKRYIETRGLQRVYRNVFQLLRTRITHLFRKEVKFTNKGVVAKIDAKNLANSSDFLKFKGKVNLVVTSPPYLNIVNYALQNWIKLWFLKEEPQKVNAELDDNLLLSESYDFLDLIVNQIKQMLAPNGIVVIVIGDVAKSDNNNISPAREMIRRIYLEGTFNYIGCISDHIHDNKKTTRIWNKTKGKATNMDRILILSNETPIFHAKGLLDNFYNQKIDFQLDPKEIENYAYLFAGLK